MIATPTPGTVRTTAYCVNCAMPIEKTPTGWVHHEHMDERDCRERFLR